jgi:NADP-dependent 3-hydroxy acid dehydrogenase YdfG
MITGATSGIGEALLAQYHLQGHHVIACGRNEEKLVNLAATYAQLDTLAFDVTNKVAIEEAAKSVSKVDILILNAGDCSYVDDPMAFNGDAFANIINTNLISVGFLLQHFLPKLSAGGQLVFISSSATILPFPRAEAYGASKAGLDYLANSLRIDLIPHNINVTLVHPGFVKTPLTNKNTFNMPFMLTSDEAAETIYKAVATRKDYLHFPKRLTMTLKVISFLPNRLWLWLAKKSVQQ